MAARRLGAQLGLHTQLRQLQGVAVTQSMWQPGLRLFRRDLSDRSPPPPTLTSSPTTWPERVPGVLLTAAVAKLGFIGADTLGTLIPISGIPMALLTGFALSNVRPTLLPAAVRPGVDFASTQLLRLGIVCVGFKLSLPDVLQSGLHGLPVVAATVGTGLLVIPRLSRLCSLPPRLGALLAAGTSICGVTAIVTLAPLIKATQREVAVATANVVAFGLGGMLLYPYVAQAICHSPEQVGVFLGTAVHDTSQVLGAALGHFGMYGDATVVEMATITKLTRNLFLAPVLPYIAWTLASDVSGQRPPLRQLFPTFILGFLAAATLRSTGDMLLTEPLWYQATHVVGGPISSLLLGCAMAAVGINTKVSVFRGVGYLPFATGLLGATVVAGTGFVMSFIFI